MLNTVELRDLYAKVQTQLFYMIPEKWESIYLYASFSGKIANLESSEMFFYYYPKGLLKREPINVYEIPQKFNVDEDMYMMLVDKLYGTIKEIRKKFTDYQERVWTNLTISIANFKFTIEYNYNELLPNYSSYDRHIIWKCKYLDFPKQRLTRRDREMLERYKIDSLCEIEDTKTYSEGMYKKNVHNIVEYNREENEELSQENISRSEIVEEKVRKIKGRKEDKYLKYKKEQEEKKKEIKNQILSN